MERIKKESDLDYSKGEIVMCQLDENIHSYTKTQLKSCTIRLIFLNLHQI